MKTLSITFKNIGLLCLIAITSITFNGLKAQTTERTVSGVVKTVDGPLLGASVVLKGTTVGVASNENGAFVFPKKLKENDVLLITYLGFEDQEIKIGSNTTYIEPFLKDIPITIVGALRVEKSTASNESQ